MLNVDSRDCGACGACGDCGAGVPPALSDSSRDGRTTKQNCGAGVGCTTKEDCGAGVPPAPPARIRDGCTTSRTTTSPREIASRCEPPLLRGSCLLGDPRVAGIVQNALRHFDGRRYQLHAWCIMPNHVHVVVCPAGGHGLGGILHSWKSFTAHAINRALNRKGDVWERESFDHLIRNVEAAEAFIQYTRHNPVEAGLCAHPEDWPWSDCGHCGAGVPSARTCGAGVPPAPRARSRDGRTTMEACGAGVPPALQDGHTTTAPLEFVDPRTTPFVPPRRRGELPHLEKDGGIYFVTFRLRDAVNPTCGAGVSPAPPQSSRDGCTTNSQDGRTTTHNPQTP